MKTKYLMVIILITLVNYSQQRSFEELKQMWQGNMLKHHDQCLKETGADPKLASRIIPFGEYPDDHKVMCYMRCVCEYLGVIYMDKTVHHANFLDILYVEEPKISARANLIDKCFNIILDDACESVYRVSECIFKSVEKAMTEE